MEWSYIKDREGTFLSFSPSAERILAIKSKDVIGKKDDDLPWWPLAPTFDKLETRCRIMPGHEIVSIDITVRGDSFLSMIKQALKGDEQGRVYCVMEDVTQGHPSAEWFGRTDFNRLILPNGNILNHDQLMMLSFYVMGFSHEEIGNKCNRERSTVTKVLNEVKRLMKAEIDLRRHCIKINLTEFLISAGKNFA